MPKYQNKQSLRNLAIEQANQLFTSIRALGQANFMSPSPFLEIGVASVLLKEFYMGWEEMPMLCLAPYSDGGHRIYSSV